MHLVHLVYVCTAPTASTYVGALQILHLMPGWPVGLWTSDQPDTFGRLMQVMHKLDLCQLVSDLLLEPLQPSASRLHCCRSSCCLEAWLLWSSADRPGGCLSAGTGSASTPRRGSSFRCTAVAEPQCICCPATASLCHLALLWSCLLTGVPGSKAELVLPCLPGLQAAPLLFYSHRTLTVQVDHRQESHTCVYSRTALLSAVLWVDAGAVLEQQSALAEQQGRRSQ